MIEELQRKNERSIELVKNSDSITKCVDSKERGRPPAVDLQSKAVKINKDKRKGNKKEMTYDPTRLTTRRYK